MTSPIGGKGPIPPRVAFGSQPDVRTEPTSATPNPAPADSYTSPPKQPAVAGVGGGAQLVSSARSPKAPLTPAQSTLREVFKGIPREMLIRTIPVIENLAAIKIPILGTTISEKDGCVTLNEFKRGRDTLRKHLMDLSPKGLIALQELDDTWKRALDENDQKNPDKIRDYFMRIAEVARRMDENAPELARLGGDNNYISIRDIYNLEKLLDIP